jgi:hypothetical protein
MTRRRRHSCRRFRRFCRHRWRRHAQLVRERVFLLRLCINQLLIMHWRARKPLLSMHVVLRPTHWYRVMAYKKYAVIIAFLSVALTLASSASSGTLGGSRAARGGKSASTHSTFHPLAAQSQQRHRGRNRGAFWPTAGGFFYGPSNGKPNVDITPPISGDIHYTYTYEPLWDAAHRYPPVVSPSETIAVRVYAPGCPTQTVTVPMGDGKEQTINIVRCY